MNFLIKFLVFCFVSNVFGQSSSVFNIKKLDYASLIATNFIGKDKYGSIYYVDNNTLLKKNDYEILEYKNLNLGKIAKVDIQNPLKIIIFYYDFNAIVTLDNQLNESSSLYLGNLKSNIIAENIGMASRNKIWIFNAITLKISLLDVLNLTIEEISTPIKNNMIWSNTDFNNFWWVDANNDLYICSIFGKIKKLFKIDTFSDLQILDNKSALYSFENKIFHINFDNFKTTEIYNSEKSIVDFSFKNQILSIFTNQKLINFKLNIL